jgi:hypothetical protein
VPVIGDPPQAAARLSEAAATWIADLLGIVTTERGLRKVEHACLDRHEAEGLIRQ